MPNTLPPTAHSEHSTPPSSKPGQNGTERASRRFAEWFPDFSRRVDELVAETERQNAEFR